MVCTVLVSIHFDSFIYLFWRITCHRNYIKSHFQNVNVYELPKSSHLIHKSCTKTSFINNVCIYKKYMYTFYLLWLYHSAHNTVQAHAAPPVVSTPSPCWSAVVHTEIQLKITFAVFSGGIGRLARNRSFVVVHWTLQSWVRAAILYKFRTPNILG